MVVVRFEPEWKNALRDGFKTQTIRPMKYYAHLNVGNRIHCYLTEERESVSWPVVSEKVAEGIVTEILEDVPFREILRPDIARRDGFRNVREMRKWFIQRYRGRARGMKYRIIRWGMKK